MIKKMFVFFKISAVASTLTGCLATTNLAQDPRVDVITQGLAQKIAQLTSDRCVRTTYDRTSGKKMSGDVKIYSRVAVKKISKATDGWYKAETSADGIWDNIYYNENSIKLICGQKSWDSYSDSKKYLFNDITDTSKKLLPSITTSLPDKNLYLERSIAVSWEGYKELLVGVVKMKEGASSGTMSVPIPSTSEVCNGTYSFKSSGEGTWAISCTNSMSAAGTFQTFGANKGSAGSGTDAKGNSVKYTISGN